MLQNLLQITYFSKVYLTFDYSVWLKNKEDPCQTQYYFFTPAIHLATITWSVVEYWRIFLTTWPDQFWVI